MNRKIVIEENGKEGFEWYRVPGIVTLSSGHVMVSYEGREADSDRRVLFMRRSEDGGRTFSNRTVIAEPEGRELLHNPMLLAGEKEEVWLFWCRDYGHLYMRKSEDGGRHFGEIRDLTSCIDGFRNQWPVTLWSISPGHGIQTAKGELVLPIWLSRGENAHLPACFASLLSRDGGETWECSNVVPASGEMGDPTEASIAQCPDGSLLATMRHEKRGVRKRAFCRGDGRSWGQPWLQENVPDPVCSGSLLNMGDGRLAFINCANEDRPALEKQERGEDIRWSLDARKNLTIRTSDDNGLCWTDGLLLENEAGASDLALGDGEVLCFYEEGWTGGNSIFNRTLTLASVRV